MSGCPTCGDGVPIEVELERTAEDKTGIVVGERKVRRCGRCKRELPLAEAVAVAVKRGNRSHANRGALPPELREKPAKPQSAPQPEPVAEAAPTLSAPGQTKPLTPGGILKQARRELKQARAEIRKRKRELKRLEKSERELARLVDAADGKPRSVVTELRRSG